MTPRGLAIRLLLVGAAVGGDARAETVQDFYRRTQLTLVVGSDATGDYDVFARLLARHWGDHIPGRPNIIVQNMPGASGIKSANWLNASAARDGSTLATFNKSVPLYEATGVANTAYSSRLMNWIGSMGHSNDLVVVAARTGVRTIDDARTKSVTMGSIGAGGTMTTHPLILNNAIGTKFRLVQGYAGGQLVDLAMERGEIDGRGSYNWADLRDKHGDLVREGKVNILAQFGLEREKDLPDAPTPIELARNDLEIKAFRFLCADIAIGKAFVLPPGVAPERVLALRNAFDETMRDPEFLADARKAGADINPTDGARIQAIVESIADAPTEARDLARRWMREQ